MKFRRLLALSVLTSAAALACCALTSPALAAPFDDANPIIGTGGHGHVFPGATMPFGAVQMSPDTRDGTWDGCSGYHYSDHSIMGFSHNHLTGTGCGDLGNIMFMPMVGEVKTVVGKKVGEGYRSAFSHDNETAKPGYYKVHLDTYNVDVELAATVRAGLQRYTFPQSDASHILIDLDHGLAKTANATIKVIGKNAVSGSRASNGWGGRHVYYFYSEFSKPFASAQLYTVTEIEKGIQKADGTEAQGKTIKLVLDYKTADKDQVIVRTGVSTISEEEAKHNLDSEVGSTDFDGIVAQAKTEWTKVLSTVDIQAEDDKTRQIFYTGLYHACVAPTVLSDVDGGFRGPDGKPHKVANFDYYTELSLWDTFRAQNPLMTIVQPKRVNDVINTMLTHFTINKSLPVWPNGGTETWCMIGNHAIPVIVEAYTKGFRGFDANAALDAMVASVSQSRFGQDHYSKYGYIPYNLKGVDQTVSKTLEFAYDDACIARFAKMLHRDDIAKKFEARAENWRNVFDPQSNFMRPKDKDGKFMEPFLPMKIDGGNYTEGNAWHYAFFVPQNPAGMVSAYGGDEKFVDKLDGLFTNTEKMIGHLPDITGLIGMYAHGNEPCHHVAYLYNYAGRADRTQMYVRQVMSTLYDNQPNGMAGNDDCGQMSAWYVFSAMGFYPVDPAAGVYVIGSPAVQKATLHLTGPTYKDTTFTMVAENNSPTNIYVQSAELNGKPLNRSWFSHAELAAGGTLTLHMGPTANTQWAKDAKERPSPVASIAN